MSNLYYIYCDESCHLEKDNNDIMVLGATSCPEYLKNRVNEDIRNIKIKHNLSSWFEIKWTKVSESKADFYLDLIEYFFNKRELYFRGIVATHKSELDHDKYNDGSYDNWYYKMYFRLLDPMIEQTDEYRIFLDIKDSNGGPKVRKLHNVLCNNIYDFKHEVLRDIKQIDSKESEILQLTDLFIGALSYCNRHAYEVNKPNQGKIAIIEALQDKYGVNPFRKTSRYEDKFNIFFWAPRGI